MWLVGREIAANRRDTYLYSQSIECTLHFLLSALCGINRQSSQKLMASFGNSGCPK